MVPEAIGHLLTLGLKADEAEIYLDLLSSGPVPPDRLARDTGRDPGEVRRVLAVLAGIGLAGPVDGPGSPMSALRPEPVLEVLTRQREAELAGARAAMTRLYERYRRHSVTYDADPMIEVVSGTTAAERVQQLERSARTEVRGLDSPPYYADADANEIELENLARGVRYRAVYGRLALERPEYVAENILPCGKSGEEARVLPEVPVKLLIVDDCAALSGADRTVLLIRSCGLFDALAGLFDMCWQVALPLGLADDTSGPAIRPSERRLLSLLAAGLTDDQVARVLGVSRRTMFRYLENLMARTGAANRFQLALHATRNDWLSVDAQPGVSAVRSVPL
ncbi:helix-turn-helix domain-containing protein [Amycolatopsis sp. NPDC004079]|uniref:helix-turn-helix transcriptional regulator n=1 Tax=Amycolatopsis sp. NPDC004079 TaxID=3154549 RepID=UPI0033A76428